MPESLQLRIRTKIAPVVQLTGEGRSVYVRFQPGRKVCRTVTRSEWPLVNVDLAADDSVVGVEAVGMQEFTVMHVLDAARVHAPKWLLSRTRYLAAS